MTPDDRTPRKRRRRRRRGGGAPGTGNPGSEGNGPSPGNEASPQQYGGGGGGRRRRRSRSRGRIHGDERPRSQEAGPLPPIDIEPGQLVPAGGVLYIKPNGAGVLVNPANN